MVKIENQILKLTKFWYKYVNLDHHKDRDCKFFIEQVWEYGNKPVWYIVHYGYVGDEFMIKCKNYNEALKKLLVQIKKMINKEKQWAGAVVINKEHYDKQQIEKANFLIKSNI